MFWKTGARLYRRTDVKMTLWAFFTLLISFLIVGVFLYFYLNHHLIKEVDRFLIDETEELAGVLSSDRNGKHEVEEFENDVAGKRYYPNFFRILTGDGDPVYSSRDFGGPIFSGRVNIFPRPLPFSGVVQHPFLKWV